MPRPVLLGLVWLLGVLLATATGLLAVRVVGDQVGDDALPTVDVRAAVGAGAATRTPGSGRPSSATPAPPARTAPAAPAQSSGPVPAATRPSTAPAATVRPTAQPRPSSSRPATSAPRTFTVTGGAMSLRCTGTRPDLVYALPAQGYQLDQRSDSGSTAEVRFESSTTRSRLRASCETGSPVLVERRVDRED